LVNLRGRGQYHWAIRNMRPLKKRACARIVENKQLAIPGRYPSRTCSECARRVSRQRTLFVTA
jgi:hypothetical protein